jgi:TonB family protein
MINFESTTHFLFLSFGIFNRRFIFLLHIPGRNCIIRAEKLEMKKTLVFLILSIPFFSFAQHDNTADNSTDSLTFAKVEVESTYPGGLDGWRNFLLSNMRYPPKAAKKNIQGVVIVQFIIDKQGNVSYVEAIEGPNLLKEEGVRLIKASGKWIPAQQNGKTVKSYKKQPLIFKLVD